MTEDPKPPEGELRRGPDEGPLGLDEDDAIVDCALRDR